MRLLVVSDSHRNTDTLRNVLNMHSAVADMIIHLGDGEDEYEALIKPLPVRSIFVCGNCDFCSSYPDTKIVEFAGKKVFCTHGHRYGVKMNLSTLKVSAHNQGADIVLYGHTHVSYSSYEDGIYIVNPGSLSWRRDRPSYALIDVVDNGIIPNIVYI